MTEELEVWAIVEIFGHQRICGRISEYNLGGDFIRVDVPAVNGNAAFTKLYGPKAIYAMTFVDRDVALAAAEKLAIAPVTKYDIAPITTEAVRERLEHARLPSYDSQEDYFP